MADRNLTILALHFHGHGDVQFGPRSMPEPEEASPGLAARLRGGSTASSSESDSSGEEGGGGRKVGAALLVVLVLVVLRALAGRRAVEEAEVEAEPQGFDRWVPTR